MEHEYNEVYESPLEQIMTAEDAAVMWELSASHIKHMCQDGKLVAKKLGKTWLLLKDQPNPKHRKPSLT